uniref:Uncharacterized protein n=1 Tax=Acrobeloides nanus TaxID=290746 RepID=A0A914CR47_9BILA
MVRKTILLNSGYKIPIIGLGIWSVPHGVIGRIIKTALDIGYRYFDCTQAYGNEEEIGEAFEISYLFIILKNLVKIIWNHGKPLKRKLTKEKFARLVEAHLYFEKLELRRFCHSKNIVFIASSSLSSVGCSSNFTQANDGVDCIDPFILQLSKKFNEGIKTISMLELQSTPAKVVLCWNLQNDKINIQKSMLKVNHDSYDYKIDVDSIPEINLHDLDLHILNPIVYYTIVDK